LPKEMQSETDQRKLVEAVKDWLERSEQPWLLICDNADDPLLVAPYLPRSGNGSILLTTRDQAVSAFAAPLPVEALSEPEGIALLLKRAQRTDTTSESEQQAARRIVQALAAFPLALDQAGASIEETGCPLAEYLPLYQSQRAALLARRGKQASRYPDSGATTRAISFQEVEQAGPVAADLLRLCAFLDPDQIPEELISEGAAHWPPALQAAAADPLAFNDLLAELLKYSLVWRLPESRSLRIHRLVQAEPLYRRALAICEQQLGPLHPDTASTLNNLANLYQVQGQYAQAEPLFRRALAIYEYVLGPEHPHTQGTRRNYALLLRAMGREAEAEQMEEGASGPPAEHQAAEYPPLNCVLTLASCPRFPADS
jgi:tetratricopeptide (TPR) repeat protein